MENGSLDLVRSAPGSPRECSVPARGQARPRPRMHVIDDGTSRSVVQVIGSREGERRSASAAATMRVNALRSCAGQLLQPRRLFRAAGRACDYRVVLESRFDGVLKAARRERQYRARRDQSDRGRKRI